MRIIPLMLSIVLLILAGVQWSVFGPTLPEKIALHFNVAGAADNFGPREMLFKIELGAMVLITVVFQIVSGFLRILPNHLINLPNKEYWLAPGRREQTLDRITGMMGWGGVLTNAFLLGVFQMVIHAHHATPPTLDTAPFLGLLIGYLTLMMGAGVFSIMGFRRP